jgi:hypothetical protein
MSRHFHMNRPVSRRKGIAGAQGQRERAPGLCFTRAQGGDSSRTVTAVIPWITQEELDGLDTAAPVAAVR